MTTNINEALLLSIVMAVAIFFCRVFPFLLFREKSGSSDFPSEVLENGTIASKRKTAFLDFVEKTVPPVAMTVLAFNTLTVPARTHISEIIPALIAAAFTAGVHLWRRNPLISIFGGTALFMVLQRIM